MMSQNTWERDHKDQRRNEEGMKENISKIYITKSWFFEEINEIEKSLTRVIREKRKKAKINKFKNKMKKEKLQWTMQKYKGP